MFNSEQLHCSASGSLWAARWSCSLRLANPTWAVHPPDMYALFDGAEALAGSLFALWATIVRWSQGEGWGLFPESATLDALRVDIRDRSGTSVFGPVVSSPGYGDVPRGVGQAGPPQSAVVVTLKADGAGRRGKRGRMYWPAPVLALDDRGLIDDYDALEFARAARYLIKRTNQLADLQYPDESPVVSVLSDRGSPGGGIVTEVAIGNQIDTQTRRRSPYPETYTSLDV